MNGEDVVRFLRVRKAPEVACPDCTGFVTFGLGPGDLPCAWHSRPWCAAFRVLPDTADGVVQLYERLCRERSDLRHLRVES